MMQSMDVRWTVTENERWSVLNALRIAADVAKCHAKDMSDIADVLRSGQAVALFAQGEDGARAADALAEQHRRNSEDFSRLYEQVEEAPRIVVCESDED